MPNLAYLASLSLFFHPTFPVDAIIAVESSGNPRAVSRCGARGLMQIMPATWREMTDEPFSRAFDPVLNRQVGTEYLAWIHRTLRRWTGTEPTIEQILAAYNGGIGRLRKVGYRVDRMPRESRRYVVKVLAKAEAK